MGGVVVGSATSIVTGAAALAAGVGILKKGDKKEGDESEADTNGSEGPSDGPGTNNVSEMRQTDTEILKNMSFPQGSKSGAM